MIDPDYAPIQSLFPRLIAAYGRQTAFAQFPNVPYGARVHIQPRLPGKPVQIMPPSPHRQGRRGYESATLKGSTFKRLGTIAGLLSCYWIWLAATFLVEPRGNVATWFALVLPVLAGLIAAMIASRSNENDTWDLVDSALMPMLLAHALKFALMVETDRDIVLSLPTSMVAGLAGVTAARLVISLSRK